MGETLSVRVLRKPLTLGLVEFIPNHIILVWVYWWPCSTCWNSLFHQKMRPSDVLYRSSSTLLLSPYGSVAFRVWCRYGSRWSDLRKKSCPDVPDGEAEKRRTRKTLLNSRGPWRAPLDRGTGDERPDSFVVTRFSRGNCWGRISHPGQGFNPCWRCWEFYIFCSQPDIRNFLVDFRLRFFPRSLVPIRQVNLIKKMNNNLFL